MSEPEWKTLPGIKSFSWERHDGRVLGVDVGAGDDVSVLTFRIDGNQLRADDFNQALRDIELKVGATTYSPWIRGGAVDASRCPYCETWFVPVVTMDFLTQRRLVDGCSCPHPQSYTQQQFDTYFRERESR